MRTPTFVLFFVIWLGAPAGALADVQSLDSRLAAQNALFEAQYQADLRASPQDATTYGDYRYNDRLNDYSPSAAVAQHARDRRFLERLTVISTDGFTEQDNISHELMQRLLKQRMEFFDLKEFEMPVTHLNGPHLELADLPLAVPFDSLKHYEDYLARLRRIPRAFAQTEEAMRAGMQDGLMPVRYLLEKIPAQCRGVIAANPFLLPTRQYPEVISRTERKRLTASITAAINQEVMPAYREFANFVAATYAPRGRTVLAASSLPGGESRYRYYIRANTTIGDLTPDEIHRIGLAEVDRIQALILGIARQEGFADARSFRESLKTNPKYKPTSAEQILADYRRYIAQMQPKLPELFTVIPKAKVTVEAVPDFEPGASTEYLQGTPDGKRPGRVIVATADFADRSLVDDEATAYHEGIPGHHMQISLAQGLSGLPKFRQHNENSGYVEGWALYAEQLGKEVGFYQDPVSDYGRLSSELFRAVRLVVDTGIHSKGWTRDRVVDYFRLSAATDEPTIQSETDRYIAWPAQALSYKLGQLKILELRRRAQRELGAKFDIRLFHDEILNGGVLPLDLLDSRTRSWIKSQTNVTH